MSGNRSACKYLIVRLPGRVLTSAHISTRVNSYTFTAQGSFCRRNVKKLILMFNQMHTQEEVEVEADIEGKGWR